MLCRLLYQTVWLTVYSAVNIVQCCAGYCIKLSDWQCIVQWILHSAVQATVSNCLTDSVQCSEYCTVLCRLPYQTFTVLQDYSQPVSSTVHYCTLLWTLLGTSCVCKSLFRNRGRKIERKKERKKQTNKQTNKVGSQRSLYPDFKMRSDSGTSEPQPSTSVHPPVEQLYGVSATPRPSFLYLRRHQPPLCHLTQQMNCSTSCNSNPAGATAALISSHRHLTLPVTSKPSTSCTASDLYWAIHLAFIVPVASCLQFLPIRIHQTPTLIVCPQISINNTSTIPSRWPRGLRRRAAAAWLQGSLVRTPLRKWMFFWVVCCVLCR